MRQFVIKEKCEELLRAAMKVAFNILCDKLENGWTREPTEKSAEFILNRCLEVNSHWKFTEREEYGLRPGHFEVTCSTLETDKNGADYFLWVLVSIEEGEKLIERFGLK